VSAPPQLSVVIITHNEAATIGDCLASVQFADEIIVVDSGSTDKTVALCRERGARVLVRAFTGFGEQKNFALDQAGCAWVLSVDADERVPAELREEILAVLGQPDACAGYRIARKNFFGDTWIRHGGWYPDYVLRLFRRGRGRFNERTVHESVQVNGPVGRLQTPLEHRTCRNLTEFARRQEHYATLAAAQLAREGRQATRTDLWVRPWWTFLKMYVGQAGFLDGVKGWQLAHLYRQYTRCKYRQLAALNRSLRP